MAIRSRTIVAARGIYLGHPMEKWLRYLTSVCTIILSAFVLSCKNNIKVSAELQKAALTTKAGFPNLDLSIPVPKDGVWGYIDKTGKWAINPQFSFAVAFEDDLAIANMGGKVSDPTLVKGGRWGFIDKMGKWVTSPQFDDGESFEEGLAAASIGWKPDIYGDTLIGGKWGFIDKTGKWIIDPQFDYVMSFKDGLAPASIKYSNLVFGSAGCGRIFAFVIPSNHREEA